jgi:hypothetical protein
MPPRRSPRNHQYQPPPLRPARIGFRFHWGPRRYAEPSGSTIAAGSAVEMGYEESGVGPGAPRTVLRKP